MDGGILRQREPVLDSVYVSHFFAMLTLTGLNPFIFVDCCRAFLHGAVDQSKTVCVGWGGSDCLNIGCNGDNYVRIVLGAPIYC